jgi:tetratricopeptide (TPR) repeat protein
MVADIWLKQDKPEQALPLYQEIFAIDPEDKRAYEEAAKILAKQGDIEQALALSQQIIAIDPESEDGYELSGQILFNAAQYEQAILFLEQTVQLNSADSLTTIMLLGQSYAALNQWPQARQAYEQAIGLDPSNYQLLVLMGEAQCHLQQPAQALFYYQQAIDFGDPSDQTQHAVDYITQQGNCPPKLN